MSEPGRWRWVLLSIVVIGPLFWIGMVAAVLLNAVVPWYIPTGVTLVFTALMVLLEVTTSKKPPG